MKTKIVSLPAPAKINLYLHITGRRDDGYHTLDTLFQLVGLYDTVRLQLRHDGVLKLHTPITGLPDSQHLAMKAACLLHTKTRQQHGYGADIWVDKQIPAGAGLGGGSSDAATTLLGLNHLWQLGFNNSELQSFGLQLGADVPFFCSQFGTARALGIGEQLTPCPTPQLFYVLIFPNCHVPTPTVFKHPDLTWNKNRAIISVLADGFEILEKSLQNDLQVVAQCLAPSILNAVNFLKSTKKVQCVRMSGTGSAVFAGYTNLVDATQAVADLKEICTKNNWFIYSVTALSHHPILECLDV